MVIWEPVVKSRSRGSQTTQASQSVSSRLSERLYLQNKSKWRVIEKDQTPDVDIWPPYIHAHMHALMYAFVCIHAHTHIYACMHTSMHAHIHAYMQTYVCTLVHVHIHVHKDMPHHPFSHQNSCCQSRAFSEGNHGLI